MKKITRSHLVNSLDYLIPISILIVTTLLFRHFLLDLKIQSIFYDPMQGWFLHDTQPWDFIYNYANIPALLLAAGALFLLGKSFQSNRFLVYRRIALFLVLLMISGPGLLINTVLKDNWGRPRPRSTEEFGGKYKFEAIMAVDPSSSGKSFPCGHATMGFYFFGLYLILRKKKKLLAIAVFTVALLSGSLIGLARIIQGGHYASDVIWAGGLIYLVAVMLFDLLGLRTQLLHDKGRVSQTRTARRIRLITGFAILLLILIIMVATPYHKYREFLIDTADSPAYGSYHSELVFCRADLIIRPDSQYKISSDAIGFGFPRSKIDHDFFWVVSDSILKVSLSQRIKGIFNELNQQVLMGLPLDRPYYHAVQVDQGDVNVIIPEKFFFDITRDSLHHAAVSLAKKKFDSVKLLDRSNNIIYIRTGDGVISISRN
ncbi:MAG: phosphatase PAP2 family protein [Candidatus Cloacimonetes bacterium]|nr:phosphatase PAP2 family protein [Candidatus Cloacimonadota bacterium]